LVAGFTSGDRIRPAPGFRRRPIQENGRVATLWVVGTPIGNLGDASPRCREILDRVDVIACEDTRRTGKLLESLGVEARRRMVSHFEGNEERRVPELVAALRDGRDVALVSDGGMPTLSDPGYRLIREAIEAGIEVDVVPGPAAAIAALSVSGLPTDRFIFEGFPPRKAGARKARLEEVAGDPRTLVFFESPRRVGAFLLEAAEVLGPDRPAVVARELTKLHGEVVRGGLAELADRFAVDVKGEVTVVIGGAPATAPDIPALARRVNELVAGGLARKEAAARVAAESGAPKRAVYDASLQGDTGPQNRTG
jgi:16S rRNA (cytidine1402-2'-O)-methyltransferase